MKLYLIYNSLFYTLLIEVILLLRISLHIDVNIKVRKILFNLFATTKGSEAFTFIYFPLTFTVNVSQTRLNERFICKIINTESAFIRTNNSPPSLLPCIQTRYIHPNHAFLNILSSCRFHFTMKFTC